MDWALNAKHKQLETDEHRIRGIGPLVYTNQMPFARQHFYGTGERLPKVLTTE
jgi:hypothetical protein